MKYIAFTGPESTGKTTLAAQLAEEFCSIWVPEYARGYLEDLGNKNYSEEDLLNILEGQLSSMEIARTADTPFVFFDTECLVLKIWFEDKFGYSNQAIEKAWKEQDMDLYVLCDTDVSWTYDPLRENPDDRDRLLELYKKELDAADRKYLLLSGSEDERLDALTALLMKFT